MLDHTGKNPSLAADRSLSLTASERAGRFVPLLLELVLIAAVLHSFQIELHRHFFPVFCVIVAGFAIHTWLPSRQRLAFFAFLSAACVLFVLGTANGLWVLGIGSALIGICYLPVAFGMRVVLLAAAGVALAGLRVQHPLPFWPVLGSMFMFRLICFMYERRHEGVPPSLASSVSYFFLLPNACFPLFPVVDYKTFRETWYNEDEWEIYQRGVTWIVRGIVHLLLYRYIKSHLVPDDYELTDLPRLAIFMATNYALYLQVSGQFHLVTGLLHLFGFNLPRTHHLYFLASSCSDIWRRINIYWKDFLAKVVFYPAFFALRRRGAAAGTAMVLSVFLVFVCTWLFHSWQTFWLLGRFPLTVNDACLWLGAGTAVAINVALESRRNKSRETSALFAAFSVSARTVLMFSLVSLFWACWTRPDFLNLIGGLLNRTDAARGMLVVLMGMFAAVAVGMALSLGIATGKLTLPAIDFGSSVKLHLAALGLIVAFTSPWSGSLFNPELEKSISDFRVDPAMADVAGEKLQSYYEDLNAAPIQAGPLISSFSPRDDASRPHAEGFYKVSRQADMYQQIELIPGIETELDGHLFSVNQFGMRDRKSLARAKPRAVIRIALVGSSIVMGSGVSDEEVFAREFEARLNRLRKDQSRAVEVLNFGVGKQWAPQRLVRIQRKVMGFEPDSLFYFAHQDEFQELASHTAQLLANRRPLSSQHLQDVANKAQITPEMAPGEIQGRLGRHEVELLSAVYQTIVDECRSRKIVPVWIYLPIPGVPGEDPAPKLIPLAKNSGFIACDLSDWTTTREGLFDSAEEVHPNARGHQLIADALMRLVQGNSETLPMLPIDGKQ